MTIYDSQLKLQCGELEDELTAAAGSSWKDRELEFDNFMQDKDEDSSGDKSPLHIVRNSLDKDVQAIAYKKCFGGDMPDFAKLDLGVFREDETGNKDKCACEALACLPPAKKGFKSVVAKQKAEKAKAPSRYRFK